MIKLKQYGTLFSLSPRLSLMIVKNAFAKQYPGIKEAKWEKEKGDFEVVGY